MSLKKWNKEPSPHSNMNDSPCRGCGRRSVAPNCHGYCQEYKDWRAEVWAEKDALRDWTEADDINKERLAKNCRRAGVRRQVGQR